MSTEQIAFSERFNHWTGTSPQLAFEAQSKLLEGIEHKTKLVKVDGNEINTIIINEHEQKNLVMNHGYGAGLGFFYKIYKPLSSLNYRIYSIDWLGMGISSRPSFVKSTGDPEQDAKNAEDFFVESLEGWRKQMGLETMTLMGHSLGGYMSSCYALKYPERVEKLILLSPVGVPHKPEPKPDEQPSMLFRFFRQMWSWNVTPMSVLRTFGPTGKSLLRTYTGRRFANLEKSEFDALENYLYHISAQNGSGEFALSRVLLPGAFARKPLCTRLPELKSPVTFIYGDVDWMDFTHATKILPDFKVDAKVAVVKNAGHHLYFDNAEALSHSILSEFKELPKHEEVTYFDKQRPFIV